MSDTNVSYIITLNDKFSTKLKLIKNSVSGFNNKLKTTDKQLKTTKKNMGGFGNSLKKVGGLLAGAFAVQQVFDFGKAILKLGADMEQTEISFEVMLGSAEKAKKMIGDLQKFGAETPYNTKGLSENAKLLMNFGISGERVLPILQNLGDIASGDANKMNSLTLAFAQSQSAGKLMGQDLLQMINAGFNPLKIISEKTGKSMSYLKDQMSKGAISSKMVADAFAVASAKGGLFYKMMDKQSQTALGKWSTFVDNLQIIGINIGKKLLPSVKKVLSTLSGFFDRNMSSIMGIIDAFVSNFNIITDTFKYAFEPVASLFAELKKLYDAFGFVTSGGGVLITVMKVLAFTTKLVFTPLRMVLTVLKYLTKGITAVVSWGRRMYHSFSLVREVVDTMVAPIKYLISAFMKLKSIVFDDKDDKKTSPLSAVNDFLKPHLEFFERLKTLDIQYKNEAQKRNIEAYKAQLKHVQYLNSIGVASPKQLTKLVKLKQAIGKIKEKNDFNFDFGGVAGGETKTEKITKTTNTITGSAPKIFNLNVGKLIETVNNNITNVSESTEQMTESVRDALLKMLADVQVV